MGLGVRPLTENVHHHTVGGGGGLQIPLSQKCPHMTIMGINKTGNSTKDQY